MKQSNIIFFFLFAGFVIFITLRGELPKYLAVLGIGEGSTSAQQTSSQAVTSGSGSAGSSVTIGGVTVPLSTVANGASALVNAASGNYGGTIASAASEAGSWANNTQSVPSSSGANGIGAGASSWGDLTYGG